MCHDFPISKTLTLQIDLNIVLELVILGEYSNERDYDADNMCCNSKKVHFIMTYRFGLGKHR